jgi:penicillin-binding protein 1C
MVGMGSRGGLRRITAKKGWWLTSLKIAGIVFLSAVIVLSIAILYFSTQVPSIQEISNQQISQTTKIYDRTGKVLLYQTGNGVRRTLVPFSEIPQTMKEATVAIEDQNFYNEPAFDVKAIIRAAWEDLIHGRIVEGGSTLTQQLARTAFLSLHKTFSRKLKELILAIKLNKYYSKDQILGMYLNEAPYGPNISGVQEASLDYFGVPVSQINLAQAAVLASLPQAPSYYSPWGAHVDALIARQRLVLQDMYTTGKITQAELNSALNYKVTFLPQSDSGTGIKAPYFVESVLQYLIQKYGENLVDNGGLTVITTLNWNLQQAAEQAVTAGVARDTALYGSTNGALVAQDPQTGQVLSLVGGVNYFDTKNDGNYDVATEGLRQPGSTLKPFVYLTAFNMGYTPNTVLFDTPTEFSTDPSCPAVPDFTSKNPNCFHPVDFEGTFAGPVTIRDALAQSINVPAVKMLYLVGESNAITTIENFGITTLGNPSQYGLSLVLGGGAVHLIDLTEAYSVLAADGVKHQQTMILSVKDANGNVLESYQDQATQVADPQAVREINNILSDGAARQPLFKASYHETVFPGYDVALKTGTSNDYRDAWSMGYTPSLVVGVWAGNNNNAPMHAQGSSILAAVPMWSQFMTAALPQVPNETFPQPNPITPANPALGGNYFDPQGNPHSILYFINKANPTGPSPTNPASDPQFHNWEIGVQNWWTQHHPGWNPTASTIPIATTTIP